MNSFSQYRLILASSLYFAIFYNFTFFKNLLVTYQDAGINFLTISSVFILLVCFITLLFTLFSSKYTTKPLLIIISVISAFCAYFMDTYNVVIDDNMIRNSLQTNLAESSDLFSLKLLVYIFFLAIVPAYFIFKIDIEYGSFKEEFYSKLKTILITLGISLIILFSFSKFYTSFFREHKPLRYSINPIYWIYSVGNYTAKGVNSVPKDLKKIGEGATINYNENHKRELMIMVVGEASRADRFSLNGYAKETNPLLKNENVINFSNMYSCGTSTAESVPCMFSIFGRADYDYKKGISTENVLDVLKKTGEVDILWRDNNSDSKGVALRVDFEDYRTSKTNTICDESECRDEGMIVGLDQYIKEHPNKNILIVLHQMGNHGPAYYKRYTKEFEKFTPVCMTNQLEKCSQEEVSNAYDNAILHTDSFLSKVINFLKPYSNDYETTMFYMSDHGESLGEKGLYLHGIPYFMAPEEQKHIGSLIWFGDKKLQNKIDENKLKTYNDKPFSQDNLFHTILGLFSVQTDVYKKDLDILNDAKKY